MLHVTCDGCGKQLRQGDEHHVLKIHERQQRRVGASSSTTYAPMRGHFVSGHWKVRKTGIYFWRPFKRGDFGRGTVSKDYHLDR